MKKARKVCSVPFSAEDFALVSAAASRRGEYVSSFIRESALLMLNEPPRAADCACPEGYPQLRDWLPDRLARFEWEIYGWPRPEYLRRVHTGACNVADELLSARLTARHSSG